jgi:hypothetical protein
VSVLERKQQGAPDLLARDAQPNSVLAITKTESKSINEMDKGT